MVCDCLERERAPGWRLSAARRTFVAEAIPVVLKRLRHRTLGQSLQGVSRRWAQLALLLKSGLSEAEFAQLETKAREAVPAPAGQPGWQVLAAGLDQCATSDELVGRCRTERRLDLRGTGLPETEDAAHKIFATIEPAGRIDPSSTAIE
ncbi:hypothetical protein GNI_011930 [Gregarina niphandrodes]|uniref:Uncharacterized protein n=1 Tax=Gregarina niphandrodes TaxID=110365 RepID=A0A023BCT6_GRENI|nr:hypothetical protein GNI_011930 [Gregarina niphandrodes]EZG85284.1 hypothetical protein GNI_011930 [Gregarina niphandrodes]|eukprot:XP_011128835.1 hypothetical protein GNI_011930 [Gregarina niphandrodes]